MLYKLGIVGAPILYCSYNYKPSYCDSPDSPQNEMKKDTQTAPTPEKKMTETEKQMEEIEQIFRENPYAATDPEEMERILQEKNKLKNKKPPQFAKLMMPIKMMIMQESLDGLRLDIAAPISSSLQVGGSWNFSNSKPSNFSLNAMLHSQHSPMSNEGMSFINCKKDLLGKMELVGGVSLTDSLSFKAEGFFPNQSVDAAHIQYEVLQEFSDWHISGKFGGGSYSISMMQAITHNTSAGFEAMWHPQVRDFLFCYGFKHTSGKHTILGQYLPIAKKEPLAIGYIHRASGNVSLFSEFKASAEGASETAFGCKIRFNSGQLTGVMNSQFKFSSSLQMITDAMVMATINSTMDFSKPDKPVTFGIALSFGG